MMANRRCGQGWRVKVTDEESKKQKHLEWLVESRSRNQRCAVQLRRVLRTFDKQWETKVLSAAAQELTSVSFSLWRAAFLADKEGGRSEVLRHGAEFLDKVIEDNAISYANDKAAREWTFNYYTRSARFSLEYLHKRWPEFANDYEVKVRTPKKRWEYCQSLLEIAVRNFEKDFNEKAESKIMRKREAAENSNKRQTKRRNRKLVRKMQLDGREKDIA
jgi:hypothetical protein